MSLTLLKKGSARIIQMVRFMRKRENIITTHYVMRRLHKKSPSVIKKLKNLSMDLLMKDAGAMRSTIDSFKVSFIINWLILIFTVAMGQYGNNWVKVQEIVKTRSSAQIRSHAQKFKLK